MIRSIMLQDLDFDALQIECRSSRGCPYYRQVRVGMPRVSQDVIASVFYLYRNAEDAKRGINPGGTGFIVANPVNGVYVQRYGVTNWHVACRDGYSVVRINTLDGGTDVFEFGSEDWDFIPSGPDVAIVALELDAKFHAVNSVDRRLFPTTSDSRRLTVGDDVFMLGLFADHAGIATNTPLARFGNISMMTNPKALIKQPTGYEGESYIIDLHSRSGFSGSPVFVYRTPLSDLSDGWSSRPTLRGRVNVNRISSQLRGYSHSPHEVDVELKLPSTIFELLGIHWAQFPERWQIDKAQTICESEKNLLVQGDYTISGVSGMTCVIPTWEIKRVLDMPKLETLRNKKAEAIRRDKAQEPVSESALEGPTSDPGLNPQHREDCNSLLDAAVKEIPSKH